MSTGPRETRPHRRHLRASRLLARCELAGRRRGFVLWVLGAALLVALFLPWVLHRQYHIDEIQVAFNAALWAKEEWASYANYNAPALAPLGWLSRLGHDTATKLLVLRSVAFVGGLLNLMLIALVQPYATGTWGRLIVLLGAATAYPIWVHGFELRHDTLTLTVELVLYGLAQSRILAGRWGSRCVIAGALSIIAQVHSTKAVLGWLPLAGLVLASAICTDRARTVRVVLAYLLGLAAGLCAMAAVLALAGRLGPYLAGYAAFAGTAAASYRFAPWRLLAQFAIAAPALALGATAFLLVMGHALVRERPRLGFSATVTLVALTSALAGLWANPTPFPYNVVHLAPFALFASVDFLQRLWIEPRRVWASALSGLAVVIDSGGAVHMLATEPFATTSNSQQLEYARAAESLTAANEPILDGAGLVLTRPPPDRDWMVHSLFMDAYRRGDRRSIGDMLESPNPPPVVMTNYRWTWLEQRDLTAARQRYVPLAIDFWVLGARGSGPSFRFAIARAGRYRVDVSEAPPAARAHTLLDGRPWSDVVASLGVGFHLCETTGGESIAVTWVGPQASELPRLGFAAWHPLFFSD